MTSACESSFADSGVGSNVWESTPSGIMPSTVAAVPTTFLAMSVRGDTVVATRSFPLVPPALDEHPEPRMEQAIINTPIRRIRPSEQPGTAPPRRRSRCHIVLLQLVATG